MEHKVSFHTLGCKLNFAESSTLARQLADAGFGRTDSATSADVCVVNTCSVTAASDKKCRNLIRHIHRENPSAVIVVTGCYAQLRPDDLAAVDGVDLVLGNNLKGELAARVAALIEERKGIDGGLLAAAGSENALLAQAPDRRRWRRASCEPRSYDRFDPRRSALRYLLPPPGPVPPVHLPHSQTAWDGGADKENGTTSACEAQAEGWGEATVLRRLSPLHLHPSGFFAAYSGDDRTRAFLKVQDGCDYHCSYCTIPAARGASRNIPITDVVAQARLVAAAGHREIVLTGINTGDFGRTTGESFLDLLQALDQVEGIERYRISSIEPNLLDDRIIAFTAASRKFMPHFHIPLQSGCDRILAMMRRRYTTATFAGRVEAVRCALPDAFIGADVIVAFPGETEADFEATYAFLERIAPSFLHIFPYSARPGTPAAAMPGQVDPRTAAQRAARLGELNARLSRAFYERFTGRRDVALMESTRRDGRMGGFTPNYLRVEVPYDRTLAGRLVAVELTQLNEKGIFEGSCRLRG